MHTGRAPGGGMIRHGTRTRTMALLWAAVVGSGCGAGEAPGAVVRDSAGIRIVENDRPAWSDEQRWRVGPEPSVDIGGDSAPAYLLNAVRGAQRLSDGRIAVMNGGSADVRLFDSTGRHLSTIGRRGQGPGEFAAPSRVLELPGDSLLVLDNNFRLRFTLFDPEERAVRSYMTPLSLGSEMELIGWFRDGSSLLRRQEHGAESATIDPVWTYGSLFRLGVDGTSLDSLGRFPNQTRLERRHLHMGATGARGRSRQHDVLRACGLLRDSIVLAARRPPGDHSAFTAEKAHDPGRHRG